jgi:hypothetical protein
MSMKIERSGGPNKGQYRDSWVIVNLATKMPTTFGNGLVVYPCLRLAKLDAEPGHRITKFRYEHLVAVYGDRRRKGPQI